MAQGKAWPQKNERNYIKYKLGLSSDADAVYGKTRLQMLRGYREGLVNRTEWPEDLNKSVLLGLVDDEIQKELIKPTERFAA